MILLNERGEKPKVISQKKADKLLEKGEAILVPKTKDKMQLLPKSKVKKTKKDKRIPMQFSKQMVIMAMGIIFLAYLLNFILAWYDKAQVEMGVQLATAFGGIVAISYAGMNAWRDVTTTKSKGYDLNKLKEVQKVMKAMNGEEF